MPVNDNWFNDYLSSGYVESEEQRIERIRFEQIEAYNQMMAEIEELRSQKLMRLRRAFRAMEDFYKDGKVLYATIKKEKQTYEQKHGFTRAEARLFYSHSEDWEPLALNPEAVPIVADYIDRRYMWIALKFRVE